MEGICPLLGKSAGDYALLQHLRKLEKDRPTPVETRHELTSRVSWLVTLLTNRKTNIAERNNFVKSFFHTLWMEA